MNIQIIRSIFFALFVLASAACFASQPKFQEGKHYLRLTSNILENDHVENFRKSEPGRVQVLEFFSYGCSWCYRLEEHVQKWKDTKADYISFHRVPVEFQPSWGPLTRAFYTAQNLDVLDKIHEPLFEAIHTDKIQNGSDAVLGAFFKQYGVDIGDFEKTFSSFDVSRMQKWASSISQAYRITSIPSFVVQGPDGAFLTSVRMAEGEENLFAVIDELAKEQSQIN